MTTFEKEYLCVDCGLNARSNKGVIYIRRKVNEKWDNVPQCEACWVKQH